MCAAGVFRTDAAEGIFVPEEFDLQEHLRDVRRGPVTGLPSWWRIGRPTGRRDRFVLSAGMKTGTAKVPVPLSVLRVAGRPQTQATARRERPRRSLKRRSGNPTARYASRRSSPRLSPTDRSFL